MLAMGLRRITVTIAAISLVVSGIICKKPEAPGTEVEQSQASAGAWSPNVSDHVIAANVVINNMDSDVAILKRNGIDYFGPARLKLLPQLRSIEQSLRQQSLEELLTTVDPADLEELTGTTDLAAAAVKIAPSLEENTVSGPIKKIVDLYRTRALLNSKPINWRVDPWVNERTPAMDTFIVDMHIPDQETDWPPPALTLVFVRQPDGDFRITLDYSIENQLNY